MAYRKRPASDLAPRKPKIVYPTTLQPDPQDRVPTMSIADSAMLQATLKQSRYNWTHSAFTRFIPEPAVRGPGGKKYASELALASVCTVCIGPHIFLDTKFYTVHNPAPPPLPLTPTPGLDTPTTSTSSQGGTPTEEYPPTLLSTPAIIGGAPSAERVLELIMIKTASTAAEVEAVATAVAADVDLETFAAFEKSTAGTLEPESVGERPEGPLSSTMEITPPERPRSLVESMDKMKLFSKDWSTSTMISALPSSSKGRSLQVRQERPRHQIAFEFSEAPGHRWLFPRESSIELAPAAGDDEPRISASFYLPTMEETRVGLAGPGAIPVTGLIPGPAQATTMVILQASMELWKGLEQSINENAATYRFMMDKLRHAPSRTYIPYHLPIDFPNERLEPMGLRLVPDHKVVTLESLQPPKRGPEGEVDSYSKAKSKRARNQDDQAFSRSVVPGFGSRNGMNVSSTSPVLKQCLYCGRNQTPMWRRGPAGNHTLCNACGLQWKYGNILQDQGKYYDAEMTSAPPQSEPPHLITTAEAALSMQKDASFKDHSTVSSVQEPQSPEGLRPQSKSSGKRSLPVDGSGSASEGAERHTSSSRKRPASKVSVASDPAGPKMVPIHQIGDAQKQSRMATSLKKDRILPPVFTTLSQTNSTDISMAASDSPVSQKSSTATSTVVTPTTATSSPALPSTTTLIAPTLTTPTQQQQSQPPPNSTQKAAATVTKPPATVIPKAATAFTTAKATVSKPSIPRTPKSKPVPPLQTTTTSTTTISATSVTSSAATSTTTTPKPSPPTSSGAKMTLLKSYGIIPKYQMSHPASAATSSLGDDGLALYATKNLYTNNTATFPLHFPTISIAFGPNNAHYMYPNCAVILFENHFQIKLIQGSERAEIDIRKEGIERSEFQAVDVGDGESMILLKATLRQYLTRFGKDLLNPDKNENTLIFRFRERLDGGGPPVKPLLEQWLTTEIPVAGTPAAGGSNSLSSGSLTVGPTSLSSSSTPLSSAQTSTNTSASTSASTTPTLSRPS